jgi:hypothetical protein
LCDPELLRKLGLDRKPFLTIIAYAVSDTVSSDEILGKT